MDLEVAYNFGGSPIKWQDHEVETLIAIQGEMEEEFTKLTKKQGMSFHGHTRTQCWHGVKESQKRKKVCGR